MNKYTGLEIAVIGMAGRFPQADAIQQFWLNLIQGKDCISDFSEEELLEEGESELLIKSPAYIRSGAYLRNKKYFDSEFFNYRPDEAELMDPQVRIYHECCWEALEDSGYCSFEYNDKIGLFAAASPNFNWNLYAQYKNREALVDEFTASCLREHNYLCSLISYKLHLTGPSVFIHTACSSSLVAIHQACNSLLLGECKMALAGGVTIYNHSKRGYIYEDGMIASRDGRCRPFDINASGTIPGEGAGVVVLKKLNEAIRDRDHIYAIIKGTAINNDGNDKVGYTAPGTSGQADVIINAMKMAGAKPDSVTYIETHGTATNLGDPVEIEALNEAYNRLGGTKKNNCALGSVKSNIGHLDSAAGVAGFIKAVLAIRHKQIPPSLHFTQPNPAIHFDEGPFYVNNRLQDWKHAQGPLRAGVSSFGIGGTNAHVVLEEAPELPVTGKSREFQLLVFSAKSKGSLERYTNHFTEFLKSNDTFDLPDIAYTLQKARARFKHRKVLVCKDKAEAVLILESNEATNYQANEVQQDLQHVVFMFSGQGSQYANMCSNLYASEPFFKDQVDTCLHIAALYSTEDFRSVLFPRHEHDEQLQDRINNTRYTQPLLFIIEYALARLLQHWGIQPAYMIGHSIGEYTAACLGNVLSLHDALKLVIKRGELMSGVEKGCMLSVATSEEELKPLLNEALDIAAVNSATSLVVSGPEAEINAFEKRVSDLGYPAKKLHTSHAFHSRMMDDILKKFEQEVATVTIHSPAIPYVSNVTGEMVKHQEIRTPSYWSTHLRNTVCFSKGVDTLLNLGNAVFIEIGPGRTLCNYASESRLKNENHHLVNLIRHPRQSAHDQQYLMEKLGDLWLKGIKINWDNYYSGEERRRIPLPAYAFEKTPYTTDVDAVKLITEQWQGKLPSAKRRIENYIHVTQWKRSVLPDKPADLLRATMHTLVFSGEENFSSMLVQYLRASGMRVICIKPAGNFCIINDGTLEMNLGDPASHEQLLDFINRSGFSFNQIIYCNALTGEPVAWQHADIEAGLQQGYLGLCYLARLIASSRQREMVNIVVVANGTANVFENDAVDPMKAMIHGPSQIMPLEIGHVKCRVVDLPYPFDIASDINRYAEAVINEVFYKSDDAYVAYRYNSRWLPTYDEMPLYPGVQSGITIRNKGTYIIAGGFGGMGFAIADDLVRRHAAHVILVHRSWFPLREEWTKWLAENSEDNDISKKIRQLQAWDHAGSTVDIYRVDLGIEEEISNLFTAIRSRQQHIHGVIWAAGEVDYGGIIINRKREDFIKYIKSKVYGVRHFEKYLDFATLDFVALFSSIGNVFYHSKFGQVAYNAANGFLENYSHYLRRQFSIHAFTINWCDWLDVGMTFETVKKQMNNDDATFINAQITDAVRPAEGVAIFHKCLQSKSPVFHIHPGDIVQEIRVRKAQTKAAIETDHAPEAAAMPAGQTDDPAATLTGLFARFFGKQDISIADDFFELGGDSLKGMTLLARINHRLGTNLSIKDLYQFPTVKQLANEVMRRTTQDADRQIPAAAEAPHYALSSAQKRLFYIQYTDPESTLYNETHLFEVSGKLDASRLEKAFAELVNRHESLRTAFILHDDMPRQVIGQFSFSVMWYEYEEDKLNGIIERLNKPFDLSIAPLFRVGVVRKAPDEHVLIIAMHHIITDGISTGILMKDFIALYNGMQLPPLPLQYKDYAEWQRQDAQQEQVRRNRDFWLTLFEALPPALNMPADFARPAERKYTGNAITFTIDHYETEKLRQIANGEGASLFMLILAIYNVLLAKLSEQDDIVVGTHTAGRPHAHLENVIGIFVNTVPLRNFPMAHFTFREFLSQVRANTLACFENEAYQYEELISDLQIHREANRNPLFDLLLTYEKSGPPLPMPGLHFRRCPAEQVQARFDLSLHVFETEQEISASFEYATELYKKSTIEWFAAYFKNIASAIIADTDIAIEDLSVVPGMASTQA